MERYGEVIRCSKDRAVVKLREHISCGGCGRCGGILGGSDIGDKFVEVLNPIGAKVGQNVVVGSEPRRVILIAFMLYMVPLFALIAGTAGGPFLYRALGYTGSGELFGLALGFVLMAIVYYLLRRWDRSVSQSGRYLVSIIR